MKVFFGELLGTFILVLLGCGSVAVAVLYDSLNLYQIAGIWTLAVAFGIMASRKYCKAHLNPAVTLGFLICGQVKAKELLPTISGQFVGAFLAALTIYLIFQGDLKIYEELNSIIRGTELSQKSSMMFGEYYPNPGNSNLSELSTGMAMLLEGLGTFILMAGIILLITVEGIPDNLLPFLIGIIVGVLIIFIAPYTQAGFNPARDLSPRLFSSLAGWKSASFNLPQLGWLTVYVLGPIIGAGLAGFVLRKRFS